MAWLCLVDTASRKSVGGRVKKMEGTSEERDDEAKSLRMMKFFRISAERQIKKRKKSKQKMSY